MTPVSDITRFPARPDVVNRKSSPPPLPSRSTLASWFRRTFPPAIGGLLFVTGLAFLGLSTRNDAIRQSAVEAVEAGRGLSASRFTSTHLDLGTLQSAATAEVALTLRNESGSQIEIDSVLSSCSCTTTRIPAAFILPGESLLLPIAIKVADGDHDAAVVVSISGHRGVIPVRRNVVLRYQSRTGPAAETPTPAISNSGVLTCTL